MVPLETLPAYTVGEIEYIVENECIEHLTDLTRRRSVIALLGNNSEQVLHELASVAGGILDWDSDRQKKEVTLALEDAASGQ
jgi:glycerol-3-phosphate dehydrogenase